MKCGLCDAHCKKKTEQRNDDRLHCLLVEAELRMLQWLEESWRCPRC